MNNNGTAGTYDDVTYLLSGNKTLSYKAAIKFPTISSSAWKVPNPSYVEINGVKWATCNIGATTPEGYGDYFAWGAIYPQAKYESADYREPAYFSYTSEKDVAYQKLGSEWHVPTQYEVSQLRDLNYVVWSNWTTVNGVKGYWVSDKDNTEQKIFLPAAGNWNNVLRYAGSAGYYWSSTSYHDNSGYSMNFYSGKQDWDVQDTPRFLGYCVRPVHN